MTHQELIAALELQSAKNDGCWKWPRAVDSKGRGRIWVNGKITLAHRAVWEAKNGPIPKGKLLCHHCDNAGCVNPKHMYVGTHADNMRDLRVRKRHWSNNNPDKAAANGARLGKSNTWVKGENNATAKLTRKKALEIRKSSLSGRKLAKIYGVAASTIDRIKTGKLWP